MTSGLTTNFQQGAAMSDQVAANVRRAQDDGSIVVGLVMPGPRSGGVRQSAQGMLDHLRRAGFQVCVFAQDEEDEKTPATGFVVLPGPRLKSGVGRIVRYGTLAMGATDRAGTEFEDRVQRAGVQVLIYPTPIACPPPRCVPFVVVIPDLMHRYYPALPEYRWPKTLARDIVYGRYARDAAAVVVDAEHGARDVEQFLGIPRSRCHVIPYLPPPSIFEHRDLTIADARAVAARFGLPEQFIFYPAQLWAHKNHDRLVEALALLKNRDSMEVPLVCAGWTDGAFAPQSARVLEKARQLGVASQMSFTGYVSAKELAALYRLSRALVFPSLLGPTNIPPLEAMAMGTPVLCSGLFGMPKQIGDAGLLFDPFSPDKIADAIRTIWTDDVICRDLVARGHARLRDLAQPDPAERWGSFLRNLLSVAMPMEQGMLKRCAERAKKQ